MLYVPVVYVVDNKYDYIYNKYLNTDKITFIGFKKLEIKGKVQFFVVFQADQDEYRLTDDNNDLLLFDSTKSAKEYLIEHNILRKLNDNK